MAWTLTNRAAGGTYEGTYSAGANVGDTFTPNQNDIIVVWNVANDATPHTAVTGWGATWTQIIAPSGALNFSVWACRIGASPGSGRAFIDFGGGSTNYSAGVIQIAGAHTTATIGVGGSNLFRQAPTPVTTYDPASPMSATTLSAFASATNLALTLAGISTNLPLVPKAGFTELFEGSGTTYNPNVYASYKAGSDTVHQVSENTAGDFDFKNVVIVGMEILEDAGGGGTYTLTAAQGSYTLTGQAAGALDGHVVSAAQGSYTLLGSAGLVDLTSAAGQGSYALTGQDTALQGPRGIAAAQGSYTLTGQSVNFLRTVISAAAYGAYTLTGIAAALRYSGAAVTSAYPKWLPLVLAKHLYWLRGYTGLTAAAISEADGTHAWAKRGVLSHIIYVDVHSVPGYPRPGYP